MEFGIIIIIVVASLIALPLVSILLAELSNIYRNNYYYFLALNSFYFVGTLDNMIYISGSKGSGKSTILGGLAYYLSMNLKKRALAVIDKIKVVYKNVDFDNFNKLIEVCYLRIGNRNATAILEVIKEIGEPKYLKEFEKSYFNKLEVYSGEEMIKKYIRAYLSLLRNNYVYAPLNGYYNYYTSSYSMNFDLDLMNIRKAFANHNFHVEDYTIIFEEEKLLSDRVSTNYKKVAKDNNGFRQGSAVFRHLYEESVYYIGISQVEKRVVKEEREQAGNFVVLKKGARKVVHCYPNRLAFYNKVYKHACKALNGFENKLNVFIVRLTKVINLLPVALVKMSNKRYLKICAKNRKNKYSLTYKSFIEYINVRAVNAVRVNNKLLTNICQKLLTLFKKLRPYILSISHYSLLKVDEYQARAYTVYTPFIYENEKDVEVNESKAIRTTLCFPRQVTDGTQKQFAFHPLRELLDNSSKKANSIETVPTRYEPSEEQIFNYFGSVLFSEDDVTTNCEVIPCD